MKCSIIKKQGDSFIVSQDILDSEGNPVDLTDSSIEMYLYHNKFGVYEANNVSFVNNMVTGSFESDQTIELLEGNYFWEVRVTDLNGNLSIHPKEKSAPIKIIRGANI